MLLAQNTGLGRGLIGVVLEEIPSAKNQIIGLRQGNEIFDERGVILSALAQPNGAKLRQRADRLCLPLRTSSTPAMNVVLTAPIPGSRTPSFPFGDAIFAGFSMPLLSFRFMNADGCYGRELLPLHKPIVSRTPTRGCKPGRCSLVIVSARFPGHFVRAGSLRIGGIEPVPRLASLPITGHVIDGGLYAMNTAETNTTGRSIWAIVAGFLVVVVLSIGTDLVLHATHVYTGPQLNDNQSALATAYRTLFAIAGAISPRPRPISR